MRQPTRNTQASPAFVPNAPRSSRRPLIIAAVVVGVVLLGVIGATGWHFLAPRANTARDNNPFATAPATGSASTPGVAATSTPAGPVVLATGSFIDTGSGDHGSGNVTIGKTADGVYILHLDQLNVSPGPALHVYLSISANPNSSDQVTNGGVDLGALTANQGSVNVSIATAVGQQLEQQQFKSVVIYCQTFAVIFTVATLQYNA